MTNHAPSASVHPYFVEGASGRLFAVHYCPRSEPWGHLVFVAPFAEEMNRCRRTVAETARGLAEIGVGCVVLDLFGTGNSEGRFDEARWEIWRDDVLATIASVEDQGHRFLGLWGVRLGAALAAEVAALRAATIPHLLMWQPVPSGTTFVSQFLRVGAVTHDANAKAEHGGVKGMRAALDRGDEVEIGGYLLPPSLASSIAQVSLADTIPDPATAVDWIEFATDEGGALAPAKRNVLEAWQSAGITVRQTIVEAPPFWMIEENVESATPVSGTVSAVTAWNA